MSWLARHFFKIPIGDFHCGLRAFKTDSIRTLNLKSSGMEFASELIIKASLNWLKVAEVSTTLKPDGRSRKPHLRTWRNGWRHLYIFAIGKPPLAFLYPGIFLASFGFIGGALTSRGPLSIANWQLDLNAFLIFIVFVLVETQTIFFGILARIFLLNLGTLPTTKSFARF